jgi:hypothetical protein
MSDSPMVDFKGLILGFSGAAMHHLKAIKDNSADSDKMNFTLARQNIEFINLLAEKTKGNLTQEEDTVIRQALLDLRMLFIEKSK